MIVVFPENNLALGNGPCPWDKEQDKRDLGCKTYTDFRACRYTKGVLSWLPYHVAIFFGHRLPIIGRHRVAQQVHDVTDDSAFIFAVIPRAAARCVT